jgi:hypothetical protein
MHGDGLSAERDAELAHRQEELGRLLGLLAQLSGRAQAGA